MNGLFVKFVENADTYSMAVILGRPKKIKNP